MGSERIRSYSDTDTVWEEIDDNGKPTGKYRYEFHAPVNIGVRNAASKRASLLSRFGVPVGAAAVSVAAYEVVRHFL